MARRRRTAVVLFTIAIALAGLAWWQWFGDSIPAQRAAASSITTFQTGAPDPGPGHPQWRTDFENLPELATGPGPWGVLHVPAWAGRTQGAQPIYDGIGDAHLDRGAAGRYTQLAGPGQVGNFGLAAHRRTRGNNFLYLPELAIGDTAIIEHGNAWLRYTILEHELLPAHNTTALLPVPHEPDLEPTRRLISLTTCAGPSGGAWGNSHRWVTRGALTGWIPRTEGTPADLATHPSDG